MKKIILLFLISVCARTGFAQFKNTSYKEALQIQKRIMLVSIEEEDKKYIEKNKKNPKQIQYYREQLANRNQFLKSALESCWTFSKTEFKTKSEVTQLLKTKPDEYSNMDYNIYNDYSWVNTGRGSNGRPAGYDPVRRDYNWSTRSRTLSNRILQLVIKMPKIEVQCNLPTVYISPGDVIFGVQQLQYTLSFLAADPKNSMRDLLFGQVEKNAPELKNKILLVNKDDLSAKLSEDEISKNYPFSFKIVSAEEIEKAIVAKDAQYAFVQLVPAQIGKGNVDVQMISNAEDGKLFFYDMPRFAVSSIQGISTATNQVIKAKDFRAFAKDVGK